MTMTTDSNDNDYNKIVIICRPMASQGGTRYEDRTMGRGGSGANNHANNSAHNYSVSCSLC